MIGQPVTRIERTMRIDCPLAEVFAFYDAPEKLWQATRPLGIQAEKLPRDLRPGSLFAYRLRRWPFDLRWEALVSEYRPGERVVDVQTRGYFLQWSYQHHFAAEGRATRVTEVMEYQLRGRVMGPLANALFLRGALEELVDGRLLKVREALEQAGPSERR